MACTGSRQNVSCGKPKQWSSEPSADDALDHVHPIRRANLGQELARVTMSFKSGIKRSKSCGGADFFRYDGAVKIRPQTNVVLTELLKQIVELPNHQVDRCVAAHMTVAAQEASRKIQSYHSPAFANGIQLT